LEQFQGNHAISLSFLYGSIKSEVLWGKDLSQLPGFRDAVTQLLKGMLAQGVSKTIQHMISR
jgi:mannitol-1-phosphate/altronate dehydrogenase